MELFYLAISQVIISVVLSILVFYVSYKVLIKVFHLKEQRFDNDNLALSIFFSSIILSTGYLLSDIISTIFNSISLIKIHNEGNHYFEVFKYSASALLLGFLVASMIQLGSFLLLRGLTKHLKEVEQLKRNNLAVAILLASILMAITFIVKDGLIFLIELFLPRPEVIEFS